MVLAIVSLILGMCCVAQAAIIERQEERIKYLESQVKILEKNREIKIGK